MIRGSDMEKPVLRCLVEACPHCGSDFGFYDRWIEAVQYQYDWDGISIGAPENRPIRGGKHFFCLICNKDVTKYVEEQPHDKS